MVKSRGRIPISRLLQQWPVVRGLSARVAHLVGSPTLHDLYLQSASLHTLPEEAVRAILGEAHDYAHEYGEIQERRGWESSRCDHKYPNHYAVEDGLAYMLYSLVRGRKPSLTVEVGVADGRSTEVILSALDVNRSGRLVSVDITKDVGGTAVGHPRWELHVHHPGRSSSGQLHSLLAEIGPPDVFFHDAMHTYYDQYADYLSAWEHMRSGGLLVSDDVDQSWAFMDLARRFEVNPVILVDRRKAAGAILVP